MAIVLIRFLACAVAVMALSGAAEPRPPAGPLAGARTLLHAHNCYPEDGRWLDRLDRALATGATPMAIEQDLAWAAATGGGPGRSVVSHDRELDGTEPTLEQHFFARVRPLMERALAEDRQEQWPLLVLHLDFKTHEPEHHQAVWDLLARHRSWLTTVDKTADAATVTPFRRGPLLVLTENGPGQERAFFERLPVGERLLLFGTIPSPALPEIAEPAARARMLATVPAETLVASGATNYRRWTNFSWQVVEQGGQAAAGDWTADEAARLRTIVTRAHDLGLWVRFYTLNGHDASDNRGWTAGYNFGSLPAVRQRWQAAIAAGVDFVATDQYEDFAPMLPRRDGSR